MPSSTWGLVIVTCNYSDRIRELLSGVTEADKTLQAGRRQQSSTECLFKFSRILFYLQETENGTYTDRAFSQQPTSPWLFPKYFWGNKSCYEFSIVSGETPVLPDLALAHLRSPPQPRALVTEPSWGYKCQLSAGDAGHHGESHTKSSIFKIT